jgi:hypothetical protein
VTGLSVIGLVNVAQAYLDPGTGSYLVQILIGGLLGGLFAVGMFWRRLWAVVRRIFSGKRDDTGPKTG